MTLVVTHAYNSTVAEGVGAGTPGGLVGPNEWNANHTLTGLATVAQGGTGVGSFTANAVLFGGSTIGGDSNFTYAGAGGQVLLGGAGSAATPSLGVGVTGTGLYSVSTTGLGLSVNGAVKLDFGITNSAKWSVGSNITLDPSGGQIDVITLGIAPSGQIPGNVNQTIVSNAAQTALVLLPNPKVNISDGVTATGLFVYNTTDTNTGTPTNYEAGILDWTTTANTLTIGTIKGGTGTGRNVNLVAGGTKIVTLTNGGGVQIGSPTGGDKGVGTINVAGTIYQNGTAIGSTLPTVQTFLSGSGTYTTPAGVDWIEVRAVAGGGGGGGSGSSQSGGLGGTGGNTTFGTSLITANGGVGGSGTAAGTGGTASVAGAATAIQVLSGGDGAAPPSNGATNAGASGGSSALGGAGAGEVGGQNGAPTTGKTNTGGGGGARTSTGTIQGGGGGGGGGFVYAIITNPSATYSYAVGAAGTAGGAGTGGLAAVAGGSGGIWVVEHYAP